MNEQNLLTKNINDFLLPVDSKNPNFQFIHIDVVEQYGIACKFEFDPSRPDYFRISEIKMVQVNPRNYNLPLEFEVDIIKECRAVSGHSEYDFKIDVELTNRPGISIRQNTGDINRDFNHNFKRKQNGEPTKEHKIDVHIKNQPISLHRLVDKKVIRFGQQFCKFYII